MALANDVARFESSEKLQSYLGLCAARGASRNHSSLDKH
jgi:hypothetical protein